MFAAEGDPGERERPEVPNHHEEPGQEICHSGATSASDHDYDEDDDDDDDEAER